MKIFVTGGTGFVGSHLVDALLARGDEVTCLVRSPAKLERLFPDTKPRVVQGDLSDDAALARALEGVELVYHVAGITAARSREEFFAINAGATQRLVRVVAERVPHLSRFVLVSSLAAMGPTERGRVRHDDEPPNPVSAYGASKLAGERAVTESDLPWTVVRPPTVYGPRDAELLRVFKLAQTGFVPLAGDVGQELSLIHVADLAAALLAAAERGAPRTSYFATHPHVMTGGDLVAHISRGVAQAHGRPAARRPRILALPPWIVRPALAVSYAAARLTGKPTVLSPDKANEFLAPAWTCSAERLVRDTGWRALREHEQGLADTARWYREHGWL